MDIDRDYDDETAIQVVPERWSLGTFYEFDFKEDTKRLGQKTAREVIRSVSEGPEAVYFRPCGDAPAISKVFDEMNVTGERLFRLLQVLHQFRCSEVEAFMQLDCAVNAFGFGLDYVSFDLVESLNLTVFRGETIGAARRAAASWICRTYSSGVSKMCGTLAGTDWTRGYRDDSRSRVMDNSRGPVWRPSRGGRFAHSPRPCRVKSCWAAFRRPADRQQPTLGKPESSQGPGVWSKTERRGKFSRMIAQHSVMLRTPCSWENAASGVPPPVPAHFFDPARFARE